MAYNPARNISQNTIKRLYGLSGNVCANPNCRKTLITENNQIGEIAHICAASPDGPRYDPNMTDDERRSINNLLLLCETCNKLVDRNAKDYPVSVLKQWKNNHEGFVSSDSYNTFFKNIWEKRNTGHLCKQDLDVGDDAYSSEIIVYDKKRVVKQDHGQYCLTNFLLSLAKDCEWDEFPDLFVQGIGGIGKSTEVKHAYNTFLDVFSDAENYDDYNFLPTVYFFELKDFQTDFFKRFDDKDNIILFLDGLDEIADTNFIKFVKSLKNIRNQFPDIRFVISGRPASFNSEIADIEKNLLTIDLSDDFDLDDPKNRRLIARYQNSAISDVISIPFYRKFLEKNENIFGYKDFYEKAVLEFLEKDKRKSDYANDISKRNDCVSTIKKEKIIEELSVFCYKIWQSGAIVFSEQELKEATNEHFNFVINSSLIKYSNTNNISFVSNLFFEYFLSLFYLNNQRELKKDLFLASGRLNVKYVNVVSIILNVAEPNAKIVSWLKRKLSKETNAFILLTDYRILPPQTRFEYYKKIFEEYSKKGKLIYYSRWQNSHDCLSGISNLSKAIRQLAPSEYKDNIVDYLISHITKYHKHRIGKNVIDFINSIMLLGAWSEKTWDCSQQEKLKDASVEIINTFLYDPLIKERAKGLLYEELVLYWYKVYGWVENWSEKDWNEFLTTIFPKTQGFGLFANDIEYHFQLEVFNDFLQDNYIKQLAKPLCVEVMKRTFSESSIASNIPNEIDDEYKTKAAPLHTEELVFCTTLKNGDFLTANDSIDIIKDLIDAHVDFHSSNYEFGELKKKIYETLSARAETLSMEKAEKLYDIISYALDDTRDFPFYEIEPCLKGLPENIKDALLGRILQDINGLNWKKDWYFWGLLSLLLDVSDGVFVEKNLQLVRRDITGENNSLLLKKIHDTVEENRPLYKAVEVEYKKKFAAKIREDKEREDLLAKIKEEHEAKLSKEGELLLNPSKITQEINNIEEFLKKHTTKDVPDYDFFDLEYETIENNIRHNVNIKCRHTPIFSDFVVKFMQSIKWNGSYSRLFEDARNLINEWFSEEKIYWICFYNCYARAYSDEDIKKFLDKNECVKNKILDSMTEDVCDLQNELDVRQVTSLAQRNWITPFIKYIHIIFEGKVPKYVNRNRLFAIIAYPSFYLLTLPTFFKNKAVWGDVNSSFDWLHKVAGFEYAEIVDKALEIYPQINIRHVKAKILSDLIKHIDCQEDRIINIVLNETKTVLAKPEKTYAGNDFRYTSLPEFWQKVDEKYLAEIIDVIPFEKYGLRYDNPCLRDVIEYALKYISIEQKKKLIAKYENSEDGEMRELLRRLGAKKEILRKISEYLHGAKCDSQFGYDHANLFGFEKKNLRILWAYWRLFCYSTKKDTERRHALATVATKGIKEHLGPWTFRVFKFLMNRKVKQRIKAGKYVDGLYNFMDEAEQKVYSR